MTAYNNYLLNWRVQANGTAAVSPQKARLDGAKAAYDVAQANCATGGKASMTAVRKRRGRKWNRRRRTCRI